MNNASNFQASGFLAKFFKTRLFLRAFCLVAMVALIIAVSNSTWAQEADAVASAQEEEIAPAQEDVAEEDAFVLEEIVVTGSNISGVGAAIGSQTIVLDNAEIQKIAAYDVADVVQTLPQVQRMYTSDDTGAGGTVTQGKAINLRGVGTNATLILVDGNRVTPGGTATGYQEAVQVPMAALERVEVVTDGLSSVYGSDAISGVVNYIMKKDYEGVEFRANYTTNSRGVNEWSTSILGGTSWKSAGPFGRGNIIVSYEHSEQDPVFKSEFPGLRQDLTPLGGNDGRLNSDIASAGNPGNIVVEGDDDYLNPDLPRAGNFVYYGLPAGTDGIGLTVDDLFLNQPNLIDESYREDYRPESTRDYFTLYLNQEIKDYLEVFVQAYYNERETKKRIANPVMFNGGSLVIDPGNPYWVDGIPGTTTTEYVGWDAVNNVPIFEEVGSITFQYDWYSHIVPTIGPFIQHGYNEALSVTTGARMRLPLDWNGEVTYSYGSDEGCGTCQPRASIVGDEWDALVANGEINPWGTEPLSEDIIDRFLGDNLQTNDNTRHDATIKFDGPLFQLPAGDVKIAVGYQYSKDTNNLHNGAHRTSIDEFIWDADTDTIREHNSMFAELYIPIVGRSSDIPFLQRIDFTASVRNDKYDNSYEESLVKYKSSFEDTNPRFGINWEVDDNIRLRGSWSTSFRAPSIPETDPGVFSLALGIPVDNYSGRDDIPTEVWGPMSNALVIWGGNEDLGPENGETWSAGFDFTPSFLDRFKLSGTYYQVTYEDKIGSVGDSTSYLNSPENAAIYDQFIIPVTPVDGCVNGDPSTWPVEVQEWYNVLYSAVYVNFCDIKAVLDGRTQNTAATYQDGIDIQLSYGFYTSIGYWNIDVNLNKIFTNEQQVFISSPVTDNLDTIYNPISFRARGNIGLLTDSWSGNLFINHIGSYTNDDPITLTGDDEPLPVSEVSSWTTFDLNLRYFFEESSIPGLSDLTLSMSITNLLDKDPPIVLHGDRGYDATNHDIMGRTFQFSLIKEF